MCGVTVEVKGIGRKRLGIPVKNVLDTIRNCVSTKEAADKLHCSTGYIFQILKANGMTLKGVKNEPTT
jgi:hypothetical protein